MKNDIEIQKNVMDELRNTPLINANEIGVSVKNGIVTLSGIVDSYPKKIIVERAVKGVPGVKGIAEDLEVHLSDVHKKSDSEIAQVVLDALHWHSAAPFERITILVEDSVVTIDGTVDWDYQRKHVTKVAENIPGVKGIINNIKIVSGPMPDDIRNKIQSAFLKNAQIDADSIKVEADGNKVILRGKVKSLSEYEEAERSAWNTPGVTEIENDLEIEDEHLV